MINPDVIAAFQSNIWQFYQEHGRSFAWRHIDDPYHVVISEIMLQQTQTDRVIPKYEAFIAAFPTIFDLSCASLSSVLTAWQGLGYNRRGKYLHLLAQKVVQEYDGKIPTDPEVLATLPGIGKATAGSICAFAYNMPTLFIETNIRAVFIHTFFSSQTEVHDAAIQPLLAATLDAKNPRDWYYALMDYGVFLKKQHKNPSKKSAHYARQSTFEGSDRQIRGAIIRILTKQGIIAENELPALLGKPPERVLRIIGDLVDEQMISRHNGLLKIA